MPYGPDGSKPRRRRRRPRRWPLTPHCFRAAEWTRHRRRHRVAALAGDRPMRVAASVHLLLRSAVLVAATIAVGSARAGCIGEPQGAGRVAEIIDIRTFRMADGAEIRLAGIEPSRD